MSSRLNLNDNVSSTFPFTIGGLDYDLKYPTLDELKPFTELTQRRAVEEAKGTPESQAEIAKIDEEMTSVFYSLIVPIGHDTPIRKTLETQPLPVIKAFNKMVTEQISAE